jgi:hypothetical protein
MNGKIRFLRAQMKQTGQLPPEAVDPDAKPVVAQTLKLQVTTHTDYYQDGMQVPPPPTHGGRREGAGRKPAQGKAPKVIVSMRVTPFVKSALARLGTEWLEQAVIDAIRSQQEGQTP